MSLLRASLSDAKRLLLISWPLILNNLFNIGVNVADTVMAGRLGATQLAAVALGSSIWITLFLAGLGVIMALGPTVAQHLGAGRIKEIGHDTRQGLWLAVFISVLISILLRNALPVMLSMDIDREVALLAQGYLNAISWGVLGCYWYHCLRQMNEGLGRTLPIMIIMGTSLPINVGLNYVFMYGKFGAPALGAIGAGLGSGITFWLMFVFIALYTSKAKIYRQFDIWASPERPDWLAMRRLVSVGLPIGGSFMLQAGLFTAVALMMGSFGTVVVAAHAVTLNFASLIFMIPLGVGMATTAVVGQAIGRGEPQNARRIGYVGIAMCLFMMCISACCTIAYAPHIARLYSGDEAVITLATSLLFIAALMQFGDGSQVTAAGALRGLKDTRVPLAINAFVYWCVGFSIAYFLGVRSGYGAHGVWIGLCCCLSVAGVLLTLRFRQVVNRHIADLRR
jgi:MATE family multidrug resistance protein